MVSKNIICFVFQSGSNPFVFRFYVAIVEPFPLDRCCFELICLLVCRVFLHLSNECFRKTISFFSQSLQLQLESRDQTIMALKAQVESYKFAEIPHRDTDNIVSG